MYLYFPFDTIPKFEEKKNMQSFKWFFVGYNVYDYLSLGEQQEVGAGGEGAAASKDMVETARAWARPVATELAALASLKQLLER